MNRMNMDKEQTSPLQISQWLFGLVSLVTPFVCMLIILTFVNVNSYRFRIITLPLFANVVVFGCWLLYGMIRDKKVTFKEVIGLWIVVCFCVIFGYLPNHPEALQAVASIINEMHDIRDCIIND